MKKAFALVLGFAVVFGVAEARADASVAVTFNPNEIIAGGLIPNGEAVFFGVMRQPNGYSTSIVRREHVALVDGSGAARLHLDDGIPLKSIWVVVDLTTGSFAASSVLFGERSSVTSGWDVRKDSAGRPIGIDLRGKRGDFLLVRPGKGVWRSQFDDGGSGDEDGSVNGRVALTVSRLRRVKGAELPNGIQEGDVVIVVESSSLRFFAVKVRR